jgi:hypothetical protein
VCELLLSQAVYGHVCNRWLYRRYFGGFGSCCMCGCALQQGPVRFVHVGCAGMILSPSLVTVCASISCNC